MFQDTRPAELDASGGTDPWRDFRVNHPQERASLLRQLRDGNVPVYLSSPQGVGLASSLWTVDTDAGRLNFSADSQNPQLPALVEADELTAVAYLDSVKLQFELDSVTLVRGRDACSLQSGLPRELYRFQRRSAYRVRTVERHTPTAHLRHPALPDMRLALRVLDVSIGGCALWQPHDVPPLQAGSLVNDVQVELDADTRFSAALTLQHVSASGPVDRGHRLGCEWRPLSGAAERTLQRWIDQAQKRRRMLSLG
jgi:c-di-GMP-binding flagellar brake protein YcgR